MDLLKRSKSFNTKNGKIRPPLLSADTENSNRKTLGPFPSSSNVKLKYTQSERKSSNFLSELRHSVKLRKTFISRNNLEKRKSQSLDDVVLHAANSRAVPLNLTFATSVPEFEKFKDYGKVLQQLKQRNSIDFASLEKINEESKKRSATPPFPVDEAVELRHGNAERKTVPRSNTSFFSPYQRSIAVDNYSKQVDIKGATKIIWDQIVRKIVKNQTVRVQSHAIIVFTGAEKGTPHQELVLRDVDITLSKVSGKKEIELCNDDDRVVCKLLFDSAKDARLANEQILRNFCRKRPNSLNEFQKKAAPMEEHRQIRYRLLKLLGKRSSKDLLEKKGILRNEPIFGNTLQNLQDKYHHNVPEFMTKIVELIEMPKNITSLGVYRASGNLAVIQKIRLNVDRNDLKILDDYKNDVDVLTGALKLFFRELNEPLITYKIYEELVRCIDKELTKETADRVKKSVEKLPRSNRETLKVLVRHLLKVDEHKDENKMDFYNLSVVWGPALMWPPDDCAENLLTNHTNANKIMEMLLNVYSSGDSDLSKKRQALQLQLENTLKKDGSRENLMKSNDSLYRKNLKSPTKEPLFGNLLENLCCNTRVPEFITKIIGLIEKNELARDVYVRPGNAIKVEKIRKKTTPNRLDYLDKHKDLVHELADALKLFVSELKEPLIPTATFARMLHSIDLNDKFQVGQTIRREIAILTPERKETLAALFKHLLSMIEQKRVAQRDLVKSWTVPLYSGAILRDSADKCAKIIELLLQVYNEPMICDQAAERFKTFSKNRSEEGLEKIGNEDVSRGCSTFPLSKNHSSLHRTSRYGYPASFYENVPRSYGERVKHEATLLDVEEKGVKKTEEYSTKL